MAARQIKIAELKSVNLKKERNLLQRGIFAENAINFLIHGSAECDAELVIKYLGIARAPTFVGGEDSDNDNDNAFKLPDPGEEEKELFDPGEGIFLRPSAAGESTFSSAGEGTLFCG